MKVYYNERAHEYEKVYFREDPIRQKEQEEIRNKMELLFKSKKVLEVACGTGYWTQFIAKTAKHITAIDYSKEVLTVAQQKGIPALKATFYEGDVYQLNKIPGSFEGCIANFWYSHVPRSKTQEFLRKLHKKLGPGAIVFMADNVYMDSIGGTLLNKENDPNTYKVRTLEDGTKYEIIKNYYTKEELRDIFAPFSNELEIHMGKCFWWISYKIK
ncbi:class I SAM-dependent methyltransferase [Microbacteriaceae bacterium 4G12]